MTGTPHPVWSQRNHGGTKPMPIPRGCRLRCAFMGSKPWAGQEVPKKGIVGPETGMGGAAAWDVYASSGHPCPERLGCGGWLQNGEIHPQAGRLGRHQHIWRWAGPGCHCRCATSPAKTSRHLRPVPHSCRGAEQPQPHQWGVGPQNPPSRGLREPTRVQPEHLTHSPHVPSQ